MKYICCCLLLSLVRVAISHAAPEIRIVNTYPMNGAVNVHPYTGIGITYSQAPKYEHVDSANFEVIGSLLGKYSGILKAAINGKTLIFTPTHPFILGESVEVKVAGFQTIEGAYMQAFLLHFTIRKTMAYPDLLFHSDDPILENTLLLNFGKYSDGQLRSGRIESDTSVLPAMNILADYNPSDGKMYIANYKYLNVQSNTFRLILGNHGDILDAQSLAPDFSNDFKPNLNGTYSYFDALQSFYAILDSDFHPIDTIKAPYGYATDGHEIRVTSEGNHLILAVDYENIDMSSYVQYGDSSAVVLVPIILEFDRDKNLIFEWRSIDHFKVTDATHESLSAHMIDFCHINAIEFDSDSNLLISSRHLDEITKIDRETGEIIWRWGGFNNQFTFAGDSVPFSHQHAIRKTTEGTYTMFDNGNFHLSQVPFSRALEYRLDQTKKIATKVWEFRHTPDVYSDAMGYVERLPNHGTFIGWGECDNVSVTEVDGQNKTQFEMQMPGSNYSYRAYKYDSNYIHGITEAVFQKPIASTSLSMTCVPNPISSQAAIHFYSTQNEYIEIGLFDVLGKEVSRIYSGSIFSGAQTFDFNCSEIPCGTYYLRAKMSNSQPIIREIIIMR